MSSTVDSVNRPPIGDHTHHLRHLSLSAKQPLTTLIISAKRPIPSLSLSEAPIDLRQLSVLLLKKHVLEGTREGEQRAEQWTALRPGSSSCCWRFRSGENFSGSFDCEWFFHCSSSSNHWLYSWREGSSSNSIKGDGERDFFIELWDVSGHDRYKDCRSLFYSQINGVIFVHDLCQRRTKTSLQKWAADIATTGTFSAPLGSGGPGGLPVPYIVIANKADIASKEGTRGSSGNLVDAARQWVEKQGLLPSSEELPLTESFPGSGGLIAAAKEARYDKEAVMKFFRMLIRRRYFSDGLPAPNPWSSTLVQRPLQRSSESLSNEDQLYKSTGSIGDPYKYNILPPLPAQHNLTPPPTLYPQQPMSTPDNNYNTIPRFALSSSHDISSSSSARSKRTDINV